MIDGHRLGLVRADKALAENNKTAAERSGYQRVSPASLSIEQPSTDWYIAKIWAFPGTAGTVVTTIAKRVVAVVDDDPGMRKALKDLLISFGYTVYVFDSAEAFLQAAPTSKADCLVIDVQLGDLSGIELARELSEAGFKFPIIFMTAVDDDFIRRQSARVGCVAYLQKPFGADLLIEAIVKATGQRSDS